MRKEKTDEHPKGIKSNRKRQKERRNAWSKKKKKMTK